MTILNSYEEIVDYMPGLNAMVVICALLAIMGGIVFALSIVSGDYTAGEIAGYWLGILFFVLVGAFMYNQGGSPIYATRYEVTLDETVSFNEIAERYDLIEQRGSIYVLQEKPQE